MLRERSPVAMSRPVESAITLSQASLDTGRGKAYGGRLIPATYTCTWLAISATTLGGRRRAGVKRWTIIAGAS